MAIRFLPVAFQKCLRIRSSDRHPLVYHLARNWLSSSSHDDDDDATKSSTNSKKLSSILKGMSVVTKEGKKSEIGQNKKQLDSDRSSSESSEESSSDFESSDDDDKGAKKEKEPNVNISTGTQKESVLSSSVISDKSHRQPLELAKPQMRKKNIQINNMDKQTTDTVLDPALVSAVKEVAGSLQSDPGKTESELFKKLQSHSVEVKNGEESKKISELLMSMEVEHTGKKKGIRKYIRNKELDEHITVFKQPFDTILNIDDDEIRLARPRLDKKPVSSVTQGKEQLMFTEARLNIFNSIKFQDSLSSLSMWNKLEALELKQISTQPFANGFEEMIHWTEENKLWHFPINNEQDIGEEANIGFHEHVFLNHHLEEGFPLKGPVRHFMELVCIGLSKNPYISVQEKKDHIDWYRQYFKDKEQYLIDVKN